MSTTIDGDHVLVDLSTMREIEGATEIDETGKVSVCRRGLDNEMKITTIQLHLGSWKVVRRGRG
jgi:hypothetical protein